ncbi:MAG: hypothetical protein M3Z04_10070 [Chloroflexota bacterium]|nr:hypothetical protein [Chloroflexota bacterium]
MKLDRAARIADAVLYEGYILYPYRPSSVKNRQRWTFGGIYPQAYSEAHGGSDAWTMQTECLVEGDAATRVTVAVRFLHIQDRVAGVLDTPVPDLPADDAPAYRPVAALQVGAEMVHTWQEVTAREILLPPLDPTTLAASYSETFGFPATRAVEAVRGPDGLVTGVIVRVQRALTGQVEVSATPLEAGLYKWTAQIRNLTPWLPSPTAARERDDAAPQAFVSTHTLLQVQDGAFVSLIDPPAAYAAHAAACRNVGAWPVLVGAEGERDLLLASPIILYDYPQIAPESPGDLFDGTEIDEILSLRILTMTDDEKQEMRQSDARGRALLERTEALSAEQFMKLHGALRTVRPLETER